MGLVDYASSDSESEAPIHEHQAPLPSKPANTKKPFQKVVDRSNPGKIVVSLPTAAQNHDDEPPSKRARVGASGGGRFSGFNSFLPPPKNPNSKPAAASSGFGSSGAGRSISLKTGAAPAFSRDNDSAQSFEDDATTATATGGMFQLPPPKKQAEPSIPEGQKPAEEVKMVGKPMMFRPLSVARNTGKKKTKSAATKQQSTTPATASSATSNAVTASEPTPPPPPPKKVSLFSMHVEDRPDASASSQRKTHSAPYEPLLHIPDDADYGEAGMTEAASSQASAMQSGSLDSVADDLNLSAAQRRELFGRGGVSAGAVKNVINFNMDQEYRHNEELRAAGEQQIHNPVRSIQAAGKNSLRQLVQNAQSQREALEESFSKGKSNRKEASNRYGW